LPQNLAVEQQPHRRGRAAKKADVDRRRPVSVWQPAAEQGRLNGAARLDAGEGLSVMASSSRTPVHVQPAGRFPPDPPTINCDDGGEYR